MEMTWLLDNLATILIAMLVLGISSGIIAGMIKNKKRGKSACGCGCSNCPMGGSCHSHQQTCSGTEEGCKS